MRYQVNSGGWETAGGWSNWTAQVTLTPGTNVVRAYAQDAAGNRSATNSASVVYVLSARLTVGLTGKGTLSPNYSNAVLELGKLHTITAAPGPGYALTNWTDGGGAGVTNHATLRFVMASNLTFWANFVDVAKPTLTLSAPTAGQRWSNAVFTVKGTAGDNGPAGAVRYQVNSGGWETAGGWSNWTAQVTLTPGTNVVRAYAQDAAGNRSATNSASVVYVETISLADYLPQPLGAEWLYEGLDWDGWPARIISRVESTNAPVILYTGRAAPRSYTTNCVRVYGAYMDPSTMVPYDEWFEYLAGGRQRGLFGSDDGEGAKRADRGLVLPAEVVLGATVTATADGYLDGEYVGAVKDSYQVIERASITVPAGTFSDVLHVRRTYTRPDATWVQDYWWARSVGLVKYQVISGDGAPEQWELIQYSLPAAPMPAVMPAAADLVRAPNAPLNFENLRVSDGRMHLHLNGPPGTMAVLESSTNMTHWTPLQTNTVPAEGLPLSLPADSQPRQFFRARLR